uniref:PID domain-containing protein n=1 Tax=Parastrongyloides trichosuri TaxID=131310 RepID=A0A0N4Z2E2_PARTI
MANFGKDVYKTLKKTISSSSSSNPYSQAYSNQKKDNDGKKTWIHPPAALQNGRVEYSLKLLGQIEVKEPKGVSVTRQAIHAIRFNLQVNQGINGHSGSKLRKVDMQISVTGVTIMDSKTKLIMSNHPLHRISFVADDKEVSIYLYDKRIFAFIAKTDETKHECFVFLSDKQAEKITLTIGEAFDLAYQKFIDNNGKDLENQKQLLMMRKRIQQLEEENRTLKEELFKIYRQTSAPPVPLTPIPSSMMGGLSISNSQNNSDKNNDIFDNNFDPRAEEKKENGNDNNSKKESDPFTSNDFFISKQSTSSKDSEHVTTIEEFDAMLSKVDERLYEMKQAYLKQGPVQLETGDVGGVGKDISDDNDSDK